jgi:hypothetical protein
MWTGALAGNHIDMSFQLFFSVFVHPLYVDNRIPSFSKALFLDRLSTYSQCRMCADIPMWRSQFSVCPTGIQRVKS